MYTKHIPTYARFQWLNNPKVTKILSRYLKPSERGRKGYDKVLMVRWLIYRQLMNCAYRDLESISGIDYSTFIKFRKRLNYTLWFRNVFSALASLVLKNHQQLFLLLDSTFVQTYSKKQEKGSAYSGYKKKVGFKLHQVIEYHTRLPLLQLATNGSVADVSAGILLLLKASTQWNVKGFAADRAYDSEFFVHQIKRKWKDADVAIPPRLFSSCKDPYFNQIQRATERNLDPELFKKRTEIERYFSRKKRVFNLGKERTRHLKNFRANSSLTSIMEILEWSCTQDSLRCVIIHQTLYLERIE